MYKKMHQEQYTILWDIHGVLFKKSLKKWAQIFLSYPKLGTLIRNLDYSTTVLLLKYCLKKVGIFGEEITNQELLNCAQQAGNKELIELTMHISCAYTPCNDTINIVKKLHTEGYTQHIGSNIGDKVFTQFAPAYQSIFNYFSSYHVVDTEDKNTVYKKPNKEFFINYLSIHKQQPQFVIFIDDRHDNVQAAHACGLIALHFKDSNRLKKDLQALGLF